MKVEKRCQCGGALKRTLGVTGWEAETPCYFYVCEECGEQEEGKGAVEKTVPCHVCGGNHPKVEVQLLEENMKVTGLYEYVPGLPSSVNVCGEKCRSALAREIESRVEAAFGGGGEEC